MSQSNSRALQHLTADILKVLRLLLVCLAFTKPTFCQTMNRASMPSGDVSQHWASFGNGGRWKSRLPLSTDSAPIVLWSKQVGEGRSQVVADEAAVYVVSGKVTDTTAKPRRINTTVSAIEKLDGQEIWSYEIASAMLKGQETFSGAKPCPRATPLLSDGRLFVVTFSGQLVCLDAKTGQPLWQTDMVQESKAEAVQFGFTSSVVADPLHSDRIWVLAAGDDGGFLCIAASSGKVLSTAECTTFSYATPVLANFGRIPQWVVASEDHVMGVSLVDGATLWKHKMPKPGLTNVPTPLVVDDKRLIVSGQGWAGTTAIQVEKKNNKWRTTQLWTNGSLRYFYTNWVRLADDIGLGCTDKYLAAFDFSTGKLLGRWRGFSDGNIISCGQNRFLIFGGQGKLSVTKFEPNNDDMGLSIENQFQLTERRCWTPLSVSGESIFARFDDRLVNFRFDSAKPQTLAAIPGGGRFLTMSPRQNTSTTIAEDPVAKIFSTFEDKGPQAAIQLYAKLRADGKLDADSRVALVEAARQVNQNAIAESILQQSLADYPDSVRLQALKR